MIIGIYTESRALADTLSLSLKFIQANVMICRDEVEVRGLLIDYDVDLILLEDCGLINGRQIGVMRSINPSLGIIFIGQGEATRRADLLADCDDYLSFPYYVGELQARVNAVGRRMKGHSQAAISIDRLSVDTIGKLARWEGLPVDLTGKEYKILECLAFRMDKIVTKVGLLEYIYLANEDPPEVKIIDVFICKLRRKLIDAGASGGIIRTVWGQGYTMEKAGPWMPINLRGKGSRKIMPATLAAVA